MQIKGFTYAIFDTYQIPKNLHFVSPLAKQKEKQNQSMKHKSSFVGETIAFSICKNYTHKHFKVVCYFQTMNSAQTYGSYIMSKFNKVNITIISLGH